MPLILHLNPHCPRHGTCPVQEDGAFNAQHFGTLLSMQESDAPVEDLLHGLTASAMEPIPLVREREHHLESATPWQGAAPEPTYECHPDTWSAMPQDFRERFTLAAGG